MESRAKYLYKWLPEFPASQSYELLFLPENDWKSFTDSVETQDNTSNSSKAWAWLKHYAWTKWTSLTRRRRAAINAFTLDSRQEKAIKDFADIDLDPINLTFMLSPSLGDLVRAILQKDLSHGPLIKSFPDALVIFDTEESSRLGQDLRAFWQQNAAHNSLAEPLSHRFIYFAYAIKLVPQFSTVEMDEDSDLDIEDPEICYRYETELLFEHFIANWAERDVHELLTYVNISLLKASGQKHVKRAVVGQLLIARYPREVIPPLHREALRWCYKTTAEDVFDYWFAPGKKNKRSLAEMLDKMMKSNRYKDMWEEVLRAEVEGRRRFRFVEYNAQTTWIPFRLGNKMLLFQESSAGSLAYANMVARLQSDTTLFDAMVDAFYSIDTESLAIQRTEDELDGSWALLPRALNGQHRPANIKKTVKL
jgi:hypothetical protein